MTTLYPSERLRGYKVGDEVLVMCGGPALPDGNSHRYRPGRIVAVFDGRMVEIEVIGLSKGVTLTVSAKSVDNFVARA